MTAFCTTSPPSPKREALLEETARLATATRRTVATLIAALAEVDARKLWADVGCSSLYTYCTQVLHFSEQEAYLRMEAARVVRQFPVVLEMLADGEVTLTNVGLLKPHLTKENHVQLLETARGKSKREVARQVAALSDAPARAIPSWITPLSEDRFWISFEIGDQTYERLQRATALLRHTVPDGNLGKVFDRALVSLLRDLERSKFAATDAPRGDFVSESDSRYIAASVRRRVWKRDGGRCAFVGTNDRCTETAFLEFHHLKPFACGGTSTLDNIELRCRAHNQREAALFFGMPMPGVVRETADSYGQLGPDLVEHAATFQAPPPTGMTLTLAANTRRVHSLPQPSASVAYVGWFPPRRSPPRLADATKDPVGIPHET